MPHGVQSRMKDSSNNPSLSSYTFEDYLRDFELDYLGFDGVPDEPVPALPGEESSSLSREPQRSRVDGSGTIRSDGAD